MNAEALKDSEFKQFQSWLYRAAGINLSPAKKALVAGRLSKRLKHHQLNSYGDYFQMIMGHGATAELQIALDLLTTNETYFFREDAHFEFLAKSILSRHPTHNPFAVWSAASSTGEEIYTISFVLADTLGLNAPWSVTGSDISTAVLDIAERGLYLLEHTRGLPPTYLHKYCLKGIHTQEGGFMIAPEIKRHTHFMQVNLNRTLPPLGKFDVIFLRNVMIYFDTDTRRQVVARLVEHLRPGGYLIVGHAESLSRLTDALHAIKPTIYQLPA